MSLDLDTLCAQANERVQAYVNRAAGQHMRAVAQGFEALRARQAAAARIPPRRSSPTQDAPRFRVVAGTAHKP